MTTLREGDRGLAVVLAKIRFDNVRTRWLLANPGQALWGPSHPENPLYDFGFWLNVYIFQSLVNRSVKNGARGQLIAVDGVLGDATIWCLAIAENSLGIHY